MCICVSMNTKKIEQTVQAKNSSNKMGSSESKNSSNDLNCSLQALESEQAFAKNKRQLEPDVIGAKLASKAQVVAMFGHGIYATFDFSYYLTLE